MIAKERLLSLGWLLIALLNAQLLQAHADHHFHGNAYGGEGWSYAQPQRPFEYQHHTSHHRHGYHHNHHYNPTDAQIGHAPSFGGGQYGGGRANDLYAGQAGVGHPRDGVRRQGQASFGNPVWSRYPETAPTRPFEQRPLPPQQSNPLDYETDRRNPTGPLFQPGGQDPSDPNYLQPGFTGNPLQPRPQPGSQDPSDPNYLQPSFTGNPLQPRPQPGGRYPPDPNYLQPGFTGNPLQLRPQPGGRYPPDPNYLQPGFTGNPLQPRPQTGGQDPSDPTYLQPGFTGNPLQPRPQSGGQDPSDPTYLQPGFTGKPLQPHPEFETQSSGTVIPQPSNTANPLQPRPVVAANGGAFNNLDPQLSDVPGKHRSNTANPSYRSTAESKSDHTVDDNIASIFKTDFTSRNQNEGNEAQGSKDPKGKAVITEPESIGERNLFDTNPICTEGTELRGGRCRHKA